MTNESARNVIHVKKTLNKVHLDRRYDIVEESSAEQNGPPLTQRSPEIAQMAQHTLSAAASISASFDSKNASAKSKESTQNISQKNMISIQNSNLK